MLILVVLVNGGTVALKWKIEEEKLELLQKEVVQVSQSVDGVNRLKEEYSAIRNELELYKGIVKDDNNGYLPYLIELSRILPPGTEITRLNFKDKKLVLLEGKAYSASRVMGVLEVSKLFDNLSFSGSIDTGEEKEQFRIVGDLVDGIK